MSKSKAKANARAARAAELRAAQAKAEQRRRLLMIGGVVAVLVLIAAVVVIATVFNRDKVEAGSAGSPYGVTIGDPEADHEVVIYEDFLCPFCGDLERATADDLEELAADGKVYVEYRPFDLLSGRFGDYPIRAANAFAVVLEEVGPEEAKRFHDILFANQPAEGSDYPTDDQLVEWAVEAGAEESAVRAGIENLEQEEWVEDATRAAADANVQGTPTVIIDGEQVSDYSSIDDLADQIIEAVE
ncbi:thioredoxin domain-containing protein [Nocardioides sp. TF02-7]|uniref:DsbA family protein n=1 Tax=Nocardioides sp. TF02-7 TaxID=2917724 RepID=UPI001F068BFC|nr:thioredoxin domain-containing protein [Nocardioides sp. TF02-7]UMG91683.1 DsbA family protein [Nocardioides sp. TF02-7]